MATLPNVSTSRRGLSPTVVGVLFALPWLISFLVFQLYPILASAYYSFTEFSLFDDPVWIGLDNYRDLIHDDRFFTSLYNTGFMTVIGVPLGLAFALICALALNTPSKLQPLYRAIVYLPTVVPIVAATYLWRWLLNAQYGYVNQVIGHAGLYQPLWQEDPFWTKPALLIMGFWLVGSTTIIFLAALKEVPRTYYEAAEIDGANWWSKFWNITWPAISPVTLFQLVIGVIGSLQYFTQAYLFAQERLNQGGGGPKDSLLMYGMYIFQNAFQYLDMGYASALAWILFLISLAVTAVILGMATRWVHYEGD
ncbi:MAG: sugar ABC transporter permease [Thermomicrobiales bacterium]